MPTVYHDGDRPSATSSTISRLVPYLVELLGPKFRIDHDYCMFMRKGGTSGDIHGSPSLQQGKPIIGVATTTA